MSEPMLKKISHYIENKIYIDYEPSQERYNSCWKAIKSNFSKVYSIELQQKWYDIGCYFLKKYIDSNKLKLILGDSNNLIHYMKDNPDFEKRTLVLTPL